MKKDFVFNTARFDGLSISVFYPDAQPLLGVVFYVHGFKGFKDWGFVPYAAQQFAASGFITVTFNFSHNGIGADPLVFSEHQKFAENTLSLELFELNALVDSVRSGAFDIPESAKIFLLGHSRGGGLALLTAASRCDVAACSLWASVAGYDRYTERQKADWRSRGYIEVMNTRTHQKMRLNVSLLDDIEQNKETSLNVLQAAQSVKVPVLIVHGEQDLAVPISEGGKIFKNIPDRFSSFISVAAAGHTFGAEHPFVQSNSVFDKVLNDTIAFFKPNTN